MARPPGNPGRKQQGNNTHGGESQQRLSHAYLPRKADFSPAIKFSQARGPEGRRGFDLPRRLTGISNLPNRNCQPAMQPPLAERAS